MGVHAGQEGLQISPGALQPTANTGCLCVPILGPAPKIYVLAQGPSSSGPECSAPALGPSLLSVSSCSSPAKGDQEDQESEDQGNLGVPPVAYSPVVGPDAGHDGGAPKGVATLQDDPQDLGQLSCDPIPQSSGGATSFR